MLENKSLSPLVLWVVVTTASWCIGLFFDAVWFAWASVIAAFSMFWEVARLMEATGFLYKRWTDDITTEIRWRGIGMFVLLVCVGFAMRMLVPVGSDWTSVGLSAAGAVLYGFGIPIVVGLTLVMLTNPTATHHYQQEKYESFFISIFFAACCIFFLTIVRPVNEMGFHDMMAAIFLALSVVAFVRAFHKNNFIFVDMKKKIVHKAGLIGAWLILTMLVLSRLYLRTTDDFVWISSAVSILIIAFGISAVILLNFWKKQNKQEEQA